VAATGGVVEASAAFVGLALHLRAPRHAALGWFCRLDNDGLRRGSAIAASVARHQGRPRGGHESFLESLIPLPMRQALADLDLQSALLPAVTLMMARERLGRATTDR
jgi:hypothetical protein